MRTYILQLILGNCRASYVFYAPALFLCFLEDCTLNKDCHLYLSSWKSRNLLVLVTAYCKDFFSRCRTSFMVCIEQNLDSRMTSKAVNEALHPV